MRTSVSLGKNRDFEQGQAFFQEILNRVRVLPGVESARYINYLPLTARGVSKGFQIEGRPAPEPGAVPLALFRPISEGYFETMRIPLIKGRFFDRTDGTSSRVAIINAAAAKKFWPDEDPIGKQIVYTSIKPMTLITIVGIVGDVRETGVEADFRPTNLTAAIQEKIWSVDRDQPISQISNMEAIVESEVKDRKVNMWLLSLFASLAIIQAMLGIYGVLASIVAQRTQEIGLRMTLGATPANILRTFMGSGIGLVLIGVVIGLGASVVLARFVASLLYGVSPTDPITFAMATLAMITVATVAICIPARRAMKIDFMTARRFRVIEAVVNLLRSDFLNGFFLLRNRPKTLDSKTTLMR
jgi:putative ABC transport system permease protein